MKIRGYIVWIIIFVILISIITLFVNNYFINKITTVDTKIVTEENFRMTNDQLKLYLENYIVDLKKTLNQNRNDVCEDISLLEYTRYTSLKELEQDDSELQSNLLDIMKNKADKDIDVIFMLIDFSYSEKKKLEGPLYASDGVKGTYIVIEYNNNNYNIIFTESWLQ